MSTETQHPGSRLSGWLTLTGTIVVVGGIGWLIVVGGRTLITRIQFESEWDTLTAPIEEHGGTVAWWTDYDPADVEGPGEIAAAISLRNPEATDQDVRYIASTFPKIYGLHLDGTQVSDEGIRHLHGMQALDRVTLENTRVTQQGINDLQAALPDCRIVCSNPLPNE